MMRGRDSEFVLWVAGVRDAWSVADDNVPRPLSYALYGCLPRAVRESLDIFVEENAEDAAKKHAAMKQQLQGATN